MGKRIAFTGGSGVVGRTVVPYLVDRGHKVLNLDLKPLDVPGVRTVVADLADSGETFNALSMHFGVEDLRTGGGPAPRWAKTPFSACYPSWRSRVQNEQSSLVSNPMPACSGYNAKEIR